MNTSPYYHIREARTQLTAAQEQKSWLLNNEWHADKQEQVLGQIEVILSTLAAFPGYQRAVLNLLRSQTWDEYQEYWWSLKVANHLADKKLLSHLEYQLPSGRVTDMLGEVILNEEPHTFYVEAKSWRFFAPDEFHPDMPGLTADQRVERMTAKLQKQLPVDGIGVWAWDKMRDGISGSYTMGVSTPQLGHEERKVIGQVCACVPQVEAVMVKVLNLDGDQIIWTVPSPNSKFPGLVTQLVAILN